MAGRFPGRAEEPSSKQVNEARRLALAGQCPQPFLICAMRSPFFEDGGFGAWSLVLSPEQSDMVGEIAEEDARRIIKINQMKKADWSQAGRVYELPGRPFAERWRGYFTTRQLMSIWNALEETLSAPVAAMDDPGIWAVSVKGAVEIHVPEAVAPYLRDLADTNNAWKASAIFRRFLNGRKLNIITY